MHGSPDQDPAFHGLIIIGLALGSLRQSCHNRLVREPPSAEVRAAALADWLLPVDRILHNDLYLEG
jgi:hypothetical protein